MSSSDSTVRLHQLASLLADSVAFLPIAQAVASGQSGTIDGAVGSSCALAVAAISRVAPGPLAVVCPTNAIVESVCDDLQMFGLDRVLSFPAWETDPGQRLVYDGIYGERLRTLKALMLAEQKCTVVCSVQSLLQPVPPPEAVQRNSLHLTVGQDFGVEQLARWLAERRFQAVSGVELPGEFARRGGLLDVFAGDWDYPVRIEWFGDQIESMRRFDVGSQRGIESIANVEITVLPAAGDDPMRAASQPRQLFDYLTDTARFVILSPEDVRREADAYLERLDHPGQLIGYAVTHESIVRRGVVEICRLADAPHPWCMQLPVESVERFSGDIGRIRDELVLAASGREVFLVCQTPAEIQRLTEVFDETPLMATGQLHFVVGRLESGFHWKDPDLIVLGGNQLFRRTVLRRRVSKRLGKRIDSFLELRENDLVVHLAHGIGRYRGLELLKRENQLEEHLVLEFHGGTRIYVPATKIELVQKYVGARKAGVKLATIGGKTWLLRKKAAEAAVQDVAVEMLELHARRAARPGIAFRADSEWQHEFDASFPFEETADQLAAIDAIKADMHSSRPMDRLLCGDVGFGKTEVGMRAAFKAVDNGYQVAVLVPTTVLAEQHYRSFRERFAEFPFVIEKLSRFCTGKEQNQIVAGLAAGKIDMVIGTHRLGSDDVRFHNLGLLIIDEEQRFGVEIKEKLKALRSTVDVLTMTATPIPRTLHISLTGMRDISNLETPPEDRLAVETRVMRWDEKVIRTAILRELNRGGQVYFVHNRIHDIENVAARLAEIVPEASLQIAHGRMNPHELEDVMVGFVDGQFDVLLATTIVESGLDIPNANTIFIDGADHYGLADLHQLRGRVGRYKHRAYCYLLVDKHKHISPDSARRLRAIEEFSQMGAGFAIAMRDLEFRGAGNILGTQQSGHIANVGYELYCQLLEAAVRRLRKMPPKLSLDVNIDLPCEAFLPSDYVPDLRMKIDLYRRIGRVSSEEDVRDLITEMRDRFGEPPAVAMRLLSLAALKMAAAIWSITDIRIVPQDGHDYLTFTYVDQGRIRQLAKKHPGEVRIVDNVTACTPLEPGLSKDAILELVAKMLAAF